MEGFKQNFESYIKSNDKKKDFSDKRYHLDNETQESILETQDEKLSLTEHMHMLLQKVDNNEEISFHEHARLVNKEGDNFVITKKGGIKEVITTGDILVAGMNGFDIKLDSKIDRLTKKRFILQETTRRIKELYNNQLMAAELKNKNNRPMDGVIGAYEKIAETKDSKAYENKKSGILAEQMVESFMTKIIADNPHLPFTLEMADVYDDVRRKIDFKLHVKKHVRGIKVESGSNTGIQFTLNQSKTALKEKQIERSKEHMSRLDRKPVDDLVLVTMSLNEVQSSRDAWLADGKQKSIAGPAEHWSSETQKLVFTKMLEKLPASLEIDAEELWLSLKK